MRLTFVPAAGAPQPQPSVTGTFRSAKATPPAAGEHPAPLTLKDKAASAESLAGPATKVSMTDVAQASADRLAKVNALLDDADVRLALMDPDMIRPEDYQKLVDGITNTTLYKTYFRDVRKALQESVDDEISSSEVRGILVDSSNVDEPHLHLFTEKLYELVQETARKLGVIAYEGGPKEAELKVLSNTAPNAYVYGLWSEKIRVHVYDAIVEVFFDNDKGDWISEEAKLILQSVLAHELWHIKDSPAEWRSWLGILARASKLIEGHEDGPMFTAAQKAQLIEKGKALLVGATAREEARHGHNHHHSHGGFFEYVLDSKKATFADDVVAQLKISPEEATKALVEIFGIDLQKRKGIERGPDGSPTKFGILQAIFQDSYQLTRAGEITADRGAFLLQGTNTWTAFMDMLLGTATDLNSFSDSTAEKKQFNERLLKKGYKSWVKKQSESLEANARNSNLVRQRELLDCVSHPPSLPRVILGEKYMDRFANPDAFPRLVKEVEKLEDPTAKMLEILRTLQRGKHQEVTKYLDPRGFEKKDATEQTQLGILFGRIEERWSKAIARALEVFDDVVTDEALSSRESKIFKQISDSLSATKYDTKGVVLTPWVDVPMEAVTKHLIERLEKLRDSASGETKELLDTRLEAMWKLHNTQLEKEKKVFKKDTPNIAKKLQDLLKAAAEQES